MECFNGEVTVHTVSIGPDDTNCSENSETKTLVLRLKRNVESFVLDLFAENNLRFAYSCEVSRTDFDKLRRNQGLKYNFEQASSKIIAFVSETKQKSDVIIQFSDDGNVARYEHLRRNEYKDSVELSLEMRLKSGDDLVDHVIRFCEKYKTERDEVTLQASSYKTELEQYKSNNGKELEELKTELHETDALLKTKEDECEEMEHELNAKHYEILGLETSYKSLREKFDEEHAYAEEVTDKLEELEAKYAEKKNQVEQLVNSREKLKLEVKKYADQNSFIQRQLNAAEERLNNAGREVERLTRMLKIKSEDWRKDNEARKTHEEILKTRLKEVEERLQQFELKDQEKTKKFANRLLNG